jgi:hypothetical protein
MALRSASWVKLSWVRERDAVYSVDTGATAAVASQLGVRHAPDGLLAAGFPVGTPSGRPCRPLRRTCLPLDGGPDSPTPGRSGPLAPCTWQPTAMSGPSAPGQRCQWTHVEAAVQRAESHSQDCAFAILGLSRVNGPVNAQMTLPLRHGGLGLSCTSPAEGSAAYLAAAATTHQAMITGPGAFRPFDGPSGVQLRTQWASLNDRAGTLWPPEYREVSPDSLETIVAAQRKFSLHTAQTRADALLECFDPNTTEVRS